MTLGFTVYVAKRIEIAERCRGGPHWGMRCAEDAQTDRWVRYADR